MNGQSVAAHEFSQAKKLLAQEDIAREDKIETLLEIADGLVNRPKVPKELKDAVELYDHALALCLDHEDIVQARITVRKGIALQRVPEEGYEALMAARTAFTEAFPVIAAHGETVELAELHFHLGVVIHGLADGQKALITDAISEYQSALRYFNSEHFPSEFALLHNNLATAFLSIPATDERSKIREALAVQSFESALEVVTLIDHPSEYAMLQNNLGNALQYSSSSHPIENNLRAIEAYDEALKVRTVTDAPIEYANTICNQANCLLNLPDDFEAPDQGNARNLEEARALYQEAAKIFLTHGETGKVNVVRETLADLERSSLG